MKLGVRLFARAKEIVGAERVELDLPDSSNVADLRSALVARFPELSPMAPNLLIAVGADYAGDGTPLDSASDVACFPPVSGG